MEGGKKREILRAEDLGKMYPIYVNESDRIREFFTGRRHLEFWALRNVTFKLEWGESLGMIGANGAGKSTLLRLLAGISLPTEGRIERAGRISTLLELGLGFKPEFSGKDNIYLNCLLMGMDKAEIEERASKIIEFAELEEFIYYPIKTYSTGMLLRLGFSIAVHADADLFLIDEVLAVGDQYFQRKCIEKIGEFIQKGKSIIFVSHDLHSVKSLCKDTVWLHAGRVMAKGETGKVVSLYVDFIRGKEGGERRKIVTGSRLLAPARDLWIDEEEEIPAGEEEAKAGEEEIPVEDYFETFGNREYLAILKSAGVGKGSRENWARNDEKREYSEHHSNVPVITGSGEAKILEVTILNTAGERVDSVRTFDPLIVAVTFKTLIPLKDPIMGVAIFRNDNVYVYGPNTRFDDVLNGTFHGVYTFFISYPKLTLLPGLYQVSVALWDRYHLRPYIWHNRLYEFRVESDRKDHGITYMEHTWGLITHLKGEAEDDGDGEG